MLKIVQTTSTCKECPQRRYFSGGQYDCCAMDHAPLPADCVIPAWCPLPDHPGKLAAVADAKARNTLEVVKDLRDALEKGGDLQWTKHVLGQAVADLEHFNAAQATGEPFEICTPLQDERWYWIEYEGLGKTYSAPAMYRANVDCFYSYEFSGIPRRQLKVLRKA